MSKVIEIIDSDEDDAPPPLPTFEIAKPPPPLVAKPAAPPVELSKSAEKEQPSVSSAASISRRNRRKSLHQPMRSSPEMQFETIALDDDDEDASAATTAVRKHATGSRAAAAAVAAHAQKSPKAFKTTPKILTPKPPTPEELAAAACEDFTNDDKTQALLRRVAEERVRINFLLASFGMPDINFSLYTQPDRLQFQLAERLKQRKMRNRGLQEESKKRRTLLQQTSTS